MPPKITTTDMKTTIKEVIKELLSDDEFIDRILNKLSQKVCELEKTVRFQDKRIVDLESRLDSCKQNEKQNNICLYGIPEGNQEKMQETVLRIFNEQMKIPIKREDVIKVYRVGNNKEKSRPVIVRLEKIQQRNTLLRNRSKLKESKLILCEDLTPARLKLYNEAVSLFDRKTVYTFEGNIYVKMEDSRVKIKNYDDLERLVRDNK